MSVRKECRQHGWALLGFLACSLGFTGQVRAQGENVTLLSNFNPTTYYSGVWGYTSPGGVELAIIGGESGTYFVNVTDPANPVQVAFITGPGSGWREIRCWGTYAYVSNETGSGLAIVNLTNPLAPTFVKNYSAFFSTCHSLHMDTQTGLLYCNGTSNGLIVLDVDANPETPPNVGNFQDYYVHDMYSRDGIGYIGAIADGALGIANVSNPANITSISLTSYSGGATHNTWLTDDSQFLLTTDETNGGHLKIWDVLNPAAPVQVSESIFTRETAIIHNVYVVGNVAFASYYTAGLQVFDVSNPYFPLQVGHYDTSPGAGGGYAGAWGCYPYAQNGNVYISDMQTGLYVLDFSPNYGYLAGTVTDASTGLPLAGVVVADVTESKSATTNAAGYYILATAPGAQDLEVTLFAYGDESATVNVSAGMTTTQNFQLDRLPAGSLSGDVRNTVGNSPLAGVLVTILGSPLTTTTAGDGTYSFSSVPAATWTVEVSKLGFGARTGNVDIIANQNNLKNWVLNPSLFVDDAETNQGWSLGVAGDNATSGIWVRANPVGTGGGAVQPEDDHTPTPGVTCFVTGNCTPGCGIGDNDVDGGVTTLQSPTFNLSTTVQPILRYWRWYTNNAGGNPGVDVWRVDISSNGGTTWIALENTNETRNYWDAKEFPLTGVIALTNNVKVRFRATDANPGSVVEAAVDDFEIFEAYSTTSDAPDLVSTLLQPGIISVGPNPVRDGAEIAFRLPAAGWAMLDVYDAQGRRVRRVTNGAFDAGVHRAFWDGRDDRGHSVPDGVYFQRLTTPGTSDSRKVTVAR